jgi:hypothetical protein
MSNWSQNIYYGTIIIPLIIGTVRINNLKIQGYHWIVFLLALTLLTELYATYLGKQGLPNAWVVNLYITVEFVILTYTFYQANHNNWLKKFIPYLFLIAAVFTLCNHLFGQKQLFNSYTFILFSFLILLYILEFIREKLITESFKIERDALFWFSVGGLIFYTGNILVTGFLPEWVNISLTLAQKVYVWNKWLNIVFYLFVGAGFYLNEN